MPDMRTVDQSTHSVNINLLDSKSQRSMIDRAADSLGKSRLEFMLETCCREAEIVLIDYRYFALDAATLEEFVALLGASPATNPRLRRLMTE